MIKTLGLFRKKPGMTRDAFVDRYENPDYGHAQFAIKLCPWQEDYRRNFLCDEPPFTYAHLKGTPRRQEMDVVMMTTARDMAQAKQTADALADPVVGRKIAEDEEALFDRTKMTIVMVDEHRTSEEKLQARPEGYAGEPSHKILSFARMRDPKAARSEFIRSHEAGLTKRVLDVLRREGYPIFARYARNYVNHDAFANQGHVSVVPPKADFDVMTEIWFWTEIDYQKFRSACRDSDIGKAFVDQSGAVDPWSISMVLVDERVHTKRMLADALAAHKRISA